MMGPRCPACSAKVKLPKGKPPMPQTKVKCPSCGSVGELEVFLQVAGFEEASAGVTIPVSDKPMAGAGHQVETVAVPEEAGVTKVAGSASKLNLPPGLRCTLSVLSGPDSGKKLKISKPRVVVGRDGADFPLTDPQIAPEHCAFEMTGVTCTVRDLGSASGTFVDGVNISSQVLSKVGEVVVGGTTLLFTMTLEETIPSE